MANDDKTEPWPLAGLRVIDFSSGIAGAYCSKLLVDAGATVVKVEPVAGDALRRWSASGQTLEPNEDGTLFQFLNASKQSIVIDRSTAAGRTEAMTLAASADIVIESWWPGSPRDGLLDHEALQARAPAVSLVSISPWGLTGPNADRPCSEFTLQAATGSIAYRGLPDRKPVFAGGRIGEWAAGAFAAVGAMSAWLSSRRTGRGHHVDVSIFECMLLCLTVYHDLNSQWVDGPLARSVEIPSVERAKDGWVGVCAITGQQWVDFCSMLGRQDIAEREEYLDGRRRMMHLPVMKEMIDGWMRERTIDEVIELACLLRIPVAPIGDGSTLPKIDHMVARGVFREGPHGFIQPRPPYRLSDAALRTPEPAPALGEHGEAIRSTLRDAGNEVDRSEAKAGASPLPLHGIRVVDMTAFWAGPFATAYLADMGADVVKIESIQRPDGMRFAGAIPNEKLWEWSPVFHGANSGKREVTLNLDSSEGKALLLRLIEGADVLVENFSARVMDHFGLDWETLHALNPKLIMVRMPAFGLDGPWRDRAGFAMTVEQAGGLAWITGYPDQPLVIRGACDPLGGMHAVFALLGALEHRNRTGEGQLVEVPLVEVAINLAAEQVIEHSAHGVLLTRDENRAPGAAPQGVYASADSERLIALSVETDAHWQSLVALMGTPAWAAQSSLAHHAGRREAHDEIDRALEAWLSTQAADACVDALLRAGVPAAHVINAHDVHPNEQLEHRGFFQSMEHPETGPTRYPGIPMAFSGLDRALHVRTPPTLGQHNDEILAGELGLDPDEMERLRKEGIIGERPSFM